MQFTRQTYAHYVKCVSCEQLQNAGLQRHFQLCTYVYIYITVSIYIYYACPIEPVLYVLSKLPFRVRKKVRVEG